MGIISKFIFGGEWESDNQEYLEQAKAFLSQTPSDLLTAHDIEVDEIMEEYTEALERQCSTMYDMFQLYDSVHEGHMQLSGAVSSILPGYGYEMRDLERFLNGPMIKPRSLNATIFDLYNAFNDAIETVGDFGSYKDISRSLLVLAKHVINKLSETGESCFITSDLLSIVGTRTDGPAEQMEVFKNDAVKNAVASLFKVNI